MKLFLALLSTALLASPLSAQNAGSFEVEVKGALHRPEQTGEAHFGTVANRCGQEAFYLKLFAPEPKKPGKKNEFKFLLSSQKLSGLPLTETYGIGQEGPFTGNAQILVPGLEEWAEFRATSGSITFLQSSASSVQGSFALTLRAAGSRLRGKEIQMMGSFASVPDSTTQGRAVRATEQCKEGGKLSRP